MALCRANDTAKQEIWQPSLPVCGADKVCIRAITNVLSWLAAPLSGLLRRPELPGARRLKKLDRAA